MKYLYFLLFATTQVVFAQQTVTPESNGIRFDPGYRVGLWRLCPTGTTALRQATNRGNGVNFDLDLASYKNWMFGVGATYARFNITDNSVVGNFDWSRYTSVYCGVSYRYTFKKRWSLMPSISVGAVGYKLQNTATEITASKQKGQEYRIGSTLNYRFGNHTAAYVGLFYAGVNVGTNTTAAFEDFYSDLSHLQLQFGIYFH